VFNVLWPKIYSCKSVLGKEDLEKFGKEFGTVEVWLLKSFQVGMKPLVFGKLTLTKTEIYTTVMLRHNNVLGILWG